MTGTMTRGERMTGSKLIGERTKGTSTRGDRVIYLDIVSTSSYVCFAYRDEGEG